MFLLVLLAQSTPVFAAFPGQNGKIVYSGGIGVYTIDPVSITMTTLTGMRFIGL
jgi:hypothetical protein